MLPEAFQADGATESLMDQRHLKLHREADERRLLESGFADWGSNGPAFRIGDTAMASAGDVRSPVRVRYIATGLTL